MLRRAESDARKVRRQRVEWVEQLQEVVRRREPQLEEEEQQLQRELEEEEE